MTGCMRRRTAIGMMAANAVTAPALAFPGWADGIYPAGKTVRIFVPFAAGGTTDILARIVAQILAEATGAKFTVENRTGGGGNVGAEIVAKSAPDGTTLLLGTVGTAITNQYFYRYLSYDGMASFAPVALVGELANVIVVHPTFPATTLKEFVDYCRGRRQQGELRLARDWQQRSPRNGVSAERGRHQAAACRPERKIADDEGPVGRSRPCRHGQPAALPAAHLVRCAQGAGRELGRPLVRHARRANHRRAAGLRISMPRSGGTSPHRRARASLS